MPDVERVRAKYRDVSDRELLITALAELQKQNGRMADLMADYYGDSQRSINGTKPQVESNTRDLDRGKTALRTIIGIVGLVGITNAVTLIAVFAGGG